MTDTPATDPVFDDRVCLTIHQPWAWLIVNGHKNIENRKSRTGYRNTLHIHAGATVDVTAYAQVKKDHPSIQLPALDEFRTGGIIGAARLASCVSVSASPWAIPGYWHYILTDAKPLPFEKLKGLPGFFMAGDSKRIWELPDGFVIKTTHLKASGTFAATLQRDGVTIYIAERNDRRAAGQAAMLEAHRLYALPSPPAALTDCACCADNPMHTPNE